MIWYRYARGVYLILGAKTCRFLIDRRRLKRVAFMLIERFRITLRTNSKRQLQVDKYRVSQKFVPLITRDTTFGRNYPSETAACHSVPYDPFWTFCKPDMLEELGSPENPKQYHFLDWAAETNIWDIRPKKENHPILPQWGFCTA